MRTYRAVCCASPSLECVMYALSLRGSRRRNYVIVDKALETWPC